MMAVDVSGFVKFMSGLGKALQLASDDTGDAILADAQANGPRLTGNMLDTGVRVSSPARNGITRVIFGGDGSGVDYARFPEFGTDNPNYPVQPYLAPAVKRNKPTHVNNVRHRIKNLERSCRVRVKK